MLPRLRASLDALPHPGSFARTLWIGIPRGAYAERPIPTLSALDKFGERAAGVVSRRLRLLRGGGGRVVALAAGMDEEMRSLDYPELREEARELRAVLRRDGLRVEPVARVFALVREAARRGLGQRHYDVQLLGGWALLQGNIAEMETGEGKTLVATLAASAAALAGVPVHIVTVNDYLVARDAENMSPIYRALGLTVGAILHGMDSKARVAEYACDVTYCSNKELAFDYLKDRITLGRVRSRTQLQLDGLRTSSRRERLLLRGLCFAIVDEADSVLVDEARTPLIISGGSQRHPMERETYETALSLARQIKIGEHYAIDPRERSVRLTPAGEARVAELTAPLGELWTGQLRARELVRQALTARFLYLRDQHYVIREGRVQIVDEYTGRRMGDRSWEHGLHQLIEVKEGCEMSGQSESLARISYQRFFRRFQCLAGMTGTAREVAGEFWSVYRLPVIHIPRHRPLQRKRLGHRVYATSNARWTHVVDRIRALHAVGQPVLVGTRSVEASEHLSSLLHAERLPHQVLNARQDREEADVIAGAGVAGRITVATNMAGRGTDIVPSLDALAVGGLHVIATEYHDARRIDRQLLGRAARQGDPGSVERVASLDDELAGAHLPRPWLSLGKRSLPSLVGESLRRLLMRAAQRRAERIHSRARRQLLKTDENVEAMLAFSGKGE